MVGIGSVNDVPRANSGHTASRDENAQLRANLTTANNVVAENRTHIIAMATMFDLNAKLKPRLEQMWREIRPAINPPNQKFRRGGTRATD